MSNNVITIRKATAQDFLPEDMRKRGAIDLRELSKLAKDAMEGSELSLAAATEIADGNFISRLWNAGEMQKHIIQSISYLGDISKVNLGLSAICNDLAAANLEHARRIDANQHSTHNGLAEVKALTGELLEDLRRPREPSLLDGLLPALGAANLADHDAMRGWLQRLSEAIDLQYSSLQASVKHLTEQQAPFAQCVDRVSAEVGSLGATLRTSLQDQKAESVQQLGLITLKLEASQQQAIFQTSQVESLLRKSHSKLEDGLTNLNLRLKEQVAEVKIAMGAEGASRDLMNKKLRDLLIQRESAIRKTISEFNQHHLKRMLWAAGALLMLQIAGFTFLSIKMGLWS